MKLFSISLAILFGFTATAFAEPPDVKVSHGGGQRIKFVTFTHRKQQTGEVVERKLPLTNGTFKAAQRSRGTPSGLESEQCIVNASFELQDGSVVQLANLDICGLDELLIE